MKKMLTGIAAVVIFSSCTQVNGWFGSNEDSTQVNRDSSSYYAFARDESITAANAYSDLFLDSAAINKYIETNNLPDTMARKLSNFYNVRNYQYAWFATDGPTEHARGLWSLYASNQHDSTSVDSTAGLKDRMDSLLQSDSTTLARSDSGLVETELALTCQLLQYASQHPEHISGKSIYYLVPAKKLEPMQLADSILNKQKDSTQYASNRSYNMLKSQLAVYYNLAKNGGWGNIPSAKGLKKGVQSPAVSAIKKRLQATGEYASGDTSTVFNDSLDVAIKNFQQRNGFQPTGVINDSLIAVMNIPVEERIEQIIVNMNRALWIPPQKDSSSIVVNIPSQMLQVYSDSGKVMEMPVIVGKEGDGTVMFSSEISRIVFNPAWNIPESIVKEEILPKMKSDKTYLKKKNMEVVKEGEIPVIRQLPGKDNPLGKVKFLFPNAHDIYLHDTPDKNLFAKKERTLSHGCIRVADAQKLAVYLLKGQSDWNSEKINSAMNGTEEQTVELKEKHPVSITYLTAWVDENGLMNFRNDVYGHDKMARTRMFMKAM